MNSYFWIVVYAFGGKKKECIYHYHMSRQLLFFSILFVWINIYTSSTKESSTFYSWKTKDTKIYQNMKNKNWLSIEKNIAKMKKIKKNTWESINIFLFFIVFIRNYFRLKNCFFEASMKNFSGWGFVWLSVPYVRKYDKLGVFFGNIRNFFMG